MFTANSVLLSGLSLNCIINLLDITNYSISKSKLFIPGSLLEPFYWFFCFFVYWFCDYFFFSKNVPWMAKALTFQIGSYVARWISLFMTCSSLISKLPHVIQTSDLTEMYSSSKHFKNTGRSFAVIIPTKKRIDQFIKSISTYQQIWTMLLYTHVWSETTTVELQYLKYQYLQYVGYVSELIGSHNLQTLISLYQTLRYEVFC